ncbi:MAG: nucleotidyltransferase domain-containing protein [Cyanobacteria bacterium K_DeepCast_35m_m2_155]|nr:nucleotidyltransferase domain-containing protein [Cyanobacteria bacterium K_DeepCast_35m_m2_155]
MSTAQATANHGLSERSVTEIRQCLAEFPQIHWVKLYGSRAMGTHWAGSDIDLAFSALEDCSAALRDALDQLPTPYLFDVTHWESLRYEPLREHIRRVGVPFP